MTSNAEKCASVDAALANYFELCASSTTGNCDLSKLGTGAEILRRYTAYRSGLNAFDSFAAATLIYQPLYLQDAPSWRTLATKLYNTLTAGQSPNQKRQTFNPEVTPAFSGAINAIEGVDYQGAKGDPNGDTFKAIYDAYIASSKFGGTQAANNILSAVSWQVNAREAAPVGLSNLETLNPILLLSSTFDPITPLVSAKNSMKSFARSKLVVTSEAGVSYLFFIVKLFF